jgi:ubiquinone/menaquinone biosynthesis C-methylase UbiE
MVHRFEHADAWVGAFDDPARDAWQHPGDVIVAMDVQDGMHVADVGAGTGYFEPWLSRAVGPHGKVLALDIEPDMVRYTKQRADREVWTNVQAFVVRVDDPMLPQASVDRVLIVDTWHHIPAREAYAGKLRRGLRHGGKVVVVDFTLESKHGPAVHHRLAPEVVAHELEAGGLVAHVVQTPLPEQYVVVGEAP